MVIQDNIGNHEQHKVLSTVAIVYCCCTVNALLEKFLMKCHRVTGRNVEGKVNPCVCNMDELVQ